MLILCSLVGTCTNQDDWYTRAINHITIISISYTAKHTSVARGSRAVSEGSNLPVGARAYASGRSTNMGVIVGAHTGVDRSWWLHMGETHSYRHALMLGQTARLARPARKRTQE